MALKYSCKENEIISYIENLNLEIILGNLDIDLKKYYIEKVLSNLENQDISTLRAYYKNNMSLKLTSEDLYIHKNTLQYKLEKIHEKCGYNPREFKDSVILYTAILLK
ncbi:MAG: PucR family transcriptional regulator [Peptostreptococcaceae bacterium]